MRVRTLMVVPTASRMCQKMVPKAITDVVQNLISQVRGWPAGPREWPAGPREFKRKVSVNWNKD